MEQNITGVVMEEDNINEMAIVDIRMSFWRMVVLSTKLAIATIPATIILFILWLICSIVIGLLFGFSVVLSELLGLPADTFQ